MVIDALVAPFQVLARQRPVIATFVQREIRTRYVTSALGIGWALIRPLLLLILYTFVFSYVLNVKFGSSERRSDYALYLFCGMVPWLAFADGITRALTAVPEQAPLVKRMRFPSEILPVHQVLVALALESLGLVILLAALILASRAPGWPMLSLAAIVIPQFLFTAGVGWAVGALSVLVPDTRQVVSFGLMFWMYATPIVYPSSLLKEPWRTICGLNPMAGVVEGFRWALLGAHTKPGPLIAVSALMAVFLLLSGAFYFRRMERTFADLV